LGGHMAGGVRPRRRGLVALAAAAGLLAAGWLAPAPWLAEHWPQVLGVVLFLVLVVPRWFMPQNDVRIGLLQAVAVVAVIAAVVVTWQQLDADRRQLRAQLAAAGQEQAADRFTRAIDQLVSERLDVRLGGIYGLERVAARAATQMNQDKTAYEDGSGGLRGAESPAVGDWPSQDRIQVFEVLSAYVRRSSRHPSIGPPGDASLAARLPDVQAAVTVLVRRAVRPGDPPLDLSGSLLPEARLDGARLAGADLRGADVRGTSLQGADLAGARLEQSLLCGAQLQGADLAGARLAGARVSAATRWPSGFDWRAAGARQVAACPA
jgi:hypothetical protein